MKISTLTSLQTLLTGGTLDLDEKKHSKKRKGKVDSEDEREEKEEKEEEPSRREYPVLPPTSRILTLSTCLSSGSEESILAS